MNDSPINMKDPNPDTLSLAKLASMYPDVPDWRAAGPVDDAALQAFCLADIEGTRRIYAWGALYRRLVRDIVRIRRKSLNPHSDIDFGEQERIRVAGRKLSPLVDWRREVL